MYAAASLLLLCEVDVAALVVPVQGILKAAREEERDHTLYRPRKRDSKSSIAKLACWTRCTQDCTSLDEEEWENEDCGEREGAACSGEPGHGNAQGRGGLPSRLPCLRRAKVQVSTVALHCIMVGAVAQTEASADSFMSSSKIMARNLAFSVLCICWTYALGIFQPRPARRCARNLNSRHYLQSFTHCQLRFTFLLFMDSWMMLVCTLASSLIMAERIRRVASAHQYYSSACAADDGVAYTPPVEIIARCSTGNSSAGTNTSDCEEDGDGSKGRRRRDRDTGAVQTVATIGSAPAPYAADAGEAFKTMVKRRHHIHDMNNGTLSSDFTTSGHSTSMHDFPFGPSLFSAHATAPAVPPMQGATATTMAHAASSAWADQAAGWQEVNRGGGGAEESLLLAKHSSLLAQNSFQDNQQQQQQQQQQRNVGAGTIVDSDNIDDAALFRRAKQEADNAAAALGTASASGVVSSSSILRRGGEKLGEMI
jgi:hypothetical protein